MPPYNPSPSANSQQNILAGLELARQQALKIQSSLNTLNQKGYGNVDISQIPQNVQISQLPPIPTNIQGGVPSYANGQLVSGSPSNTPNFSSGTNDEVLKAILDFKKTMNDSNQAVSSAQAESDAFDASRRKSFRDIEGQPISMPFLTGQESAWEKTYGDQGIALQNKLANIQAKRVADISAGTSNIDLLMKEREYQSGLNKPVTVGSGSALVDPTTGKSIYENEALGGSGAAGIQEFNLAQEQGFSGSYLDFLNAKKYVTATGKVITDPLTGKQMIINPVSNISGVGAGGSVGGGTTLGTAQAGVSLDVGARGDSVSQLQSFLNSNGYSTAPDAPGSYGQGTQRAVAAFQKATGVDTSGGGVGTFGPRTQAVASGMGFALSGGQTGGSNLSAIPAEIRASISDIGGLQFIDQSKLKSTQLPTAQRISEQYGIPLLSASQSTAIRDASSAYSSATSIVNQIASTGQGLFTAGTIQDAIAMGPVLSAQAAIKGTNANLYKSGVDSLLSILTRAAGEKGVLTSQDVQRIKNAIPMFSWTGADTAESAKQKLTNLQTLFDEIFSGALTSYIGGKSTTNMGTSGGDAEYQSYLKAIGQ